MALHGDAWTTTKKESGWDALNHPKMVQNVQLFVSTVGYQTTLATAAHSEMAKLCRWLVMFARWSVESVVAVDTMIPGFGVQQMGMVKVERVMQRVVERATKEVKVVRVIGLPQVRDMAPGRPVVEALPSRINVLPLPWPPGPNW